MKLKNEIAGLKNKLFSDSEISKKNTAYLNRFKRFSFKGNRCTSCEQYEAVITRWYHTIEKGLAYTNYRAGFGERNIDSLLGAMENYVADGFSTDEFFFKTALSTLNAYIIKNEQFGIDNSELKKRIAALSADENNCGGTIEFKPLSQEDLSKLDYPNFFESRHSMRHFSDVPLDKERIIHALESAQHTPSACNRQGWKTVIVQDKELIAQVLKNQNGNEGFGHEFDKLLLITADIRYFSSDRELFQPYIDGGMYAMSVLNALHYEGVAAVPLSASLTLEQETNVRSLLGLDEAEVPILFIGAGNYPNECKTTRSQRHSPRYKII